MSKKHAIIANEIVDRLVGIALMEFRTIECEDYAIAIEVWKIKDAMAKALEALDDK